MKPWPVTEITEQQLVRLLADGGRKVSLSDIGNWRRKGLLPPLSAHGRGPGQGKTHCWHNADIKAHAETLFDTLQKSARAHDAFLTLFLSGFSVPLPQLRRAWASHVKFRKRPTFWQTSRSGGAARPTGCNPLLDIALAIGPAIATDHHADMLPLLKRAIAKLGYAQHRHAAQIWHTLMAQQAALETSDAIRTADDTDLREAQNYVVMALTFLRGCAGQKTPNEFALTFGPSLFLFILALLRSGQGAMVEQAAARVRTMERPTRAWMPAQQPAHAAL